MTVPSRTTRTCAFRRTTPLVTMQPAIVPNRETRKSARTSASPSVSSVCTGERIRIGARPYVEADDERVRGGCKVDVVLRDPADAGVDDVDPHLGVLDLAELAEERLDRALHVGLENDVEILN